MDCYKHLSPSREALFAIGNVRFLPSFLAAALIRHLFSNWRSIIPVKSFSGFLSISYRTFLTPKTMKLIDLYRVTLIGLLVCALSAYSQQGSNNVRVGTVRERSFDRGWRFFRGELTGAEAPSFDDHSWRTLDIPHDWSIEDLPYATSNDGGATTDPAAWSVPPGAPAPNAPPVIGPFDRQNSPGQAATGYTIGGEGWYRKHFRLHELRGDQHVELRFDGVYQNADFWLNGVYLGFHPYGYTTFAFDLTPYLNPEGTNVLAVRVRNLGQNSRWYSGSGIIRHVWLTTTGPLRIPLWGVGITTPMVSEASAVVHTEVAVANLGPSSSGAQVSVTVLDSHACALLSLKTVPQQIAAGQTSTFKVNLPVTRPTLWSPDSPNRYWARTDILVNGKVVDSTTTRFGIRSILMDGQHGFLLNGKPLKMRGVSVHHDHGALGAAALDSAEVRRVEVLKAAGFNAVRTSHNPPTPAFLEACDRLGMLVYEEAFDTWQNGKNPEDYHVWFPDWWPRDIDSMVLRDRNHPCIVMWSIGNEIYTPDFANNFSPETGKELANRIRSLDSTRPITEGGWAGFLFVLTQSGTVNSVKWNYLDLGDQHYQHDYSVMHAGHPDRALLQSESFPATLYDDWKLVEDNTFAIGDFTWTGWDYLGEAALAKPRLVPVGTPPDDQLSEAQFFGGTNYFYPWFNAFSGDIDLIGQRKPQWYYRTVVWGDSPLEMAVERPTPIGMEQRATWWGYYDELQSWTWDVSAGQSMKVRVYTSGDQVRLLLNGTEVGSKTIAASDKRTTTFAVPYAPGELTAIASQAGHEISRKTFTTVGPAAALRLRSDTRGLTTNPNSLAYVVVEVVDNRGQLVPDAVTRVSFDVNGSGELAGIANANPRNVDSFRQPRRYTYHGQALAILHPTDTPGPVQLHARADGLRPATLTLVVLPEEEDFNEKDRD
jgi:beta-galactosidase